MSKIIKLSLVKKLASDTASYGLSSILARLVNFLFGFLIIKYISPEGYGVYGKFYAYAGFILVLLTHGMETAFFRFYNSTEHKEKSFSTAFFSVFGFTALFFVICLFAKDEIAQWVEEPDHIIYVYLFLGIMVFDVIAALPFAKLRADSKAKKFAILKVMNILLYIIFNLFFFIILPYFSFSKNPPFADLDRNTNVIFIFISNFIASIITLFFLLDQFKDFKKGFDFSLHKKMLKYALPIMLVGFAGMINEMLDRALMSKLLPFSKIENNIQLGIYSFNYKFSMLMTLFLQAFRYAAEPLFFANSTNKDNKIIYADTMRIFIISAGFIFMAITLNIPLIQKIFMWYSPDANIYFEGAKVIPILLVANLFLGIYFNISTWYKITDKTHIGAIISIIGAIITLVLNILWIPTLGYMGSAWATLICYGVMVALGYMAEMKYFPIHYDLKRISLYVFISILSFVFLDRISQIWSFSFFIHTLSAFILIMIYVFVVYLSEKKLRQNTKKE